MNTSSANLPLSPAARRGAAGIALVAAVTLAVRLYLRAVQSNGVLDALAYMSQYLTILTIALALLMMLWMALRRDLSPRLIKSLVIAIVCVGWYTTACSPIS